MGITHGVGIPGRNICAAVAVGPGREHSLSAATEAIMDSLLFLGTLIGVAWAVIWTVKNGAHPEGEDGSFNARGRGKSRIPPRNLRPEDRPTV